MNIFKRLTIKKKILTGFGMMIVILALISILSINLFGKVRYFTNVEFKNAIEGMHGAMDIRINYLKTVWMVLNGTTNIDASVHEEAKTALKDGREGFRIAVGQLKNSGLIDNDKLSKIEAYFSEMDRSSLNLLDLAVRKYEQMGELDNATSAAVEQGIKEGMSNADVHLLWSYAMAGNDYSMGFEKSVRDEADDLEEKVKRIKGSSSVTTFANSLIEKNKKLIKTTDDFAALLPVFNDNALRLDVTMDTIEKGNGDFEGTNKFIARASSELKTRIDNGYMLIVIVFILGGSVGILLSLFISRSISKPIDVMVEMTRDIAQGEGDLTKRIHIDSNDELGDLAKWFNMFIDKLHKIIVKISESTDALASASHELSASTKELLIGVKDQSEKTASVAAASEEMVASITEVASHTVKASEQAQSAENISQQGSRLAKDTVNGMNDIVNSANITAQNIEELANKASSIGEIIKVIDEIADQTNLLALNAAIEAARAGEQGRGFAVVADEVRKLAERTTKATKEVTETIKAIQDDVSYSKTHINESLVVVQNGKSLVEKMNTSLVEMFEAVKDVQKMINHVAMASDEQSTAVSDISKNIEHIDKITKTSSRGYEETALATESLNEQSEELSNIVKMFKI